jgi:quinohemoprotein ethanol dehydrogenase
LRASPIPLNADAFKAIVQGGALEPRGMPKFDDLSDQDLAALRQYIRERARYQPTFFEKIGAAWDFITLMIKMEWKRHFG